MKDKDTSSSNVISVMKSSRYDESETGLNNPMPPKTPGGTKAKVERPPQTTYEKIVYALDILVPPEEAEDMDIPPGHFLQKVVIGKKWKWRIAKNSDAMLPEYLIEHKDDQSQYRVLMEKETFLPLFETGSKFTRQWDLLTLILLLYTASITPFETAFMATEVPEIDLLFFINMIVDVIFTIDMFIQFRTPYKDEETGQIKKDGWSIAVKYFKGWFFLDLVSILPFEYLGFMGASGLQDLRLLRVMRLMRLLKLLRILRASRKLRQWIVYINVRYATLQIIQWSILIIFFIHWIACCYRLTAEQPSETDPYGWTHYYEKYRGYQVSALEQYMVALYWSASTISLVGPQFEVIAPSNVREFGMGLSASFISYIFAVYLIAQLSDVIAISGRKDRTQDLLADQYLEMFDKLKLDMRLKVKVYDYLAEHYALAATSAYSGLLKELPTQLHGFITMEIFIDFVADIPFLEPFIDREPLLIQDICRHVQIQSFAPNTHIFTDGYEGIYFLERGVVAMEGVIYMSGDIFGQSVLRKHIKQSECRALTTVTVHIIPLKELKEILEKYPKILYYAKRWTCWEVLRTYIITYSKLYYMAARRGVRMNPPLMSRRPYMREGEYDDIDLAVIDHLAEFGF